MEPAPAEAQRALDEAVAAPEGERRALLARIAGRHPAWPAVWAALGAVGRDDVEAYAYFRVGYHRGLDALRKAGWRGSGYVRWREPTNRGFLLALHGLERRAAAIGERDEEERCRQFLRQLDPTWPPAELAGEA